MPRKIDPIKLLVRRQGDKSLRQFAVEVGVTPAYLSDLYRGNREPGKKIMQFLGLRKTVERIKTYEKEA